MVENGLLFAQRAHSARYAPLGRGIGGGGGGAPGGSVGGGVQVGRFGVVWWGGGGIGSPYLPLPSL